MSDTDIDSRTGDWGVLHRIITEDGETRRLRLRLRDVPEGKGRKEIKVALERAGRIFSEGAIPWGNHAVLPRDEWLDLDSQPADTLTYADLLDEARGEKRVTVRLPIGLHAQLVKSAGGKSFNQFVTDTLAASIGYADETIDAALPRLAARQGVTVDTVRERMAQWGSADTSGSPFARQFGEHLAKLAGLPSEQLKARHDALTGSPEWAEALAVQERIKNGDDILGGVSDAEIADGAAKLGLTPEQFRERIKSLHEKTRDFDLATAQEQSAAQTPQEVKDTTLLLRDVFTGRATPAAIKPE